MLVYIVFYRAFVVVTRKMTIVNSVQTVTSYYVPPMICGYGSETATTTCAKHSSFCCLSGELVDHHSRLTVSPPEETCVGAVETIMDRDTHLRPAAETNSEPDVEVQCEKCRKWFSLPHQISPEDLPDVFKCTLRWWDLPSHKKAYEGEWCSSGAINRRLVEEWLKLLKDREKDVAMQANDYLEESFDPGTSSRVAEPPNIPETLISLADVPMTLISQSSNQSLEEAITGLLAQLDLIRAL